MDIRAYVLRPGPDSTAPPKLVFDVVLAHGRTHLAPGEDGLRMQAVPVDPKGELRAAWSDIWLIHCGDLNGKHWHSWSNWTREDSYRRGEPFVFESKERTPQWIRSSCPRCQKLARQGNSSRR